jgi:hypothetical protein
MRNANPPYFLHFSTDAVSSARIEHAQVAPGSCRAGQTSIHFRARGAHTWQTETGAPRADGRVPFFFRDVNVYFKLTDYVISIAADQAVDAGSFRSAMRERVTKYVLTPTRVMRSMRDQLAAALKAVVLPTEAAPRWLRPAEVAAVEAEYVARVGTVIQAYRNRVSTALGRAQTAAEPTAGNGAVYRLAPAAKRIRV